MATAEILATLTEIQPALNKRARRLTNYANGAYNSDDLLNDTNVKVLEKIDQYRGEAPLLHWAYVIMASIWNNHANRQTRMGIVYTDDTDDTATQAEVEVAGYHDTYPVLVEAIFDQLSEANREATFLSIIKDKDYSEIAQILGISEATARKRVSLGTAQLRKLWNN